MWDGTFIFGYIFILGTLCSTNAFISIPLQKERNPMANEFLNGLLNNSLVFNKNGLHPSNQLKFKNFQYYGEIKVGSPKGQPFKVSFSLLTHQIYIPSNMATVSCGPKYHAAFIEANSNTFAPLGSEYTAPMPYNKLKDGRDVVEMDGVAVNNQTISLILDGDCTGFVFDGIVGLGFNLQGQPPSLLDNFFNNKKIPQMSVGLRLNRDYTCKKDCGEIVLGGWNNKNVESKSISYIPAAGYPELYWKITLNKVLIGSQEVNKNIYGILDISSPFIIMPEADINRIKNATQFTKYNDTLYLIDKSQIKNLPSLTFNIAGKDYTLTGSDYVDKAYTGDKLSLVLITSSKGLNIPENTWILGEAFVGKYYTILDYGSRKVAFANINGASGLKPALLLIPVAVITTVLRFFVSK